MNRIFRFAIVALALMVSVQAAAKKGTTTVAVVVDEKTYQQIPQAVDAFVASMDNSYRKGVLVVDKWFNPDSINFTECIHRRILRERCLLETFQFLC